MQKILEKNKPFSLGFYEVNLKNLEENIQKIRSHTEKISGTKMNYLLPVKGNGYGCGMIEISRFIQAKKCCEYLGVAHLQEAFELRESGITLPILVLGQTSSVENFLEYIAEKNIEIAISDEKFLEEIEMFFQDSPHPQTLSLRERGADTPGISVHLKIDLGMGRCGVLEKNTLELFQKILDSKFCELKGVMMHFPVSDSEEKEDFDFTELQIQKFLEMKNEMKKIWKNMQYPSPLAPLPEGEGDSTNTEKFSDIIFHCANSGASLEHPNAVKNFDMIRPGIASYGYPEEGSVQKILDLKPVVQVYSRFTLVKEFPENFSIGYGRSYYTKKNPEKIAILPLGYADGLNRNLSNNYSVFSESGKMFPCVGRVSMDQSAYEINTPLLEGGSALCSQKIFILGKYQNAKELAKIQKTISYEIIINFGSSDRLQKIWLY